MRLVMGTTPALREPSPQRGDRQFMRRERRSRQDRSSALYAFDISGWGAIWGNREGGRTSQVQHERRGSRNALLASCALTETKDSGSPALRIRAGEIMPKDACQMFYDCTGCEAMLRQKGGDCCVFCSYRSVPGPPILKEMGTMKPLSSDETKGASTGFGAAFV
jgi:hypothetical protein